MSDPDSSSGDEEPESLVIKRKLKEDFDSLINDWKYYNDLFQQYIPENCKYYSSNSDVINVNISMSFNFQTAKYFQPS